MRMEKRRRLYRKESLVIGSQGARHSTVSMTWTQAWTGTYPSLGDLVRFWCRTDKGATGREESAPRRCPPEDGE